MPGYTLGQAMGIDLGRQFRDMRRVYVQSNPEVGGLLAGLGNLSGHGDIHRIDQHARRVVVVYLLAEDDPLGTLSNQTEGRWDHPMGHFLSSRGRPGHMNAGQPHVKGPIVGSMGQTHAYKSGQIGQAFPRIRSVGSGRCWGHGEGP